MKFYAFYMLNYELFGHGACGMSHVACGIWAMWAFGTPHFAAILNWFKVALGATFCGQAINYRNVWVCVCVSVGVCVYYGKYAIIFTFRKHFPFGRKMRLQMHTFRQPSQAETILFNGPKEMLTLCPETYAIQWGNILPIYLIYISYSLANFRVFNVNANQISFKISFQLQLIYGLFLSFTNEQFPLSIVNWALKKMSNLTSSS